MNKKFRKPAQLKKNTPKYAIHSHTNRNINSYIRLARNLVNICSFVGHTDDWTGLGVYAYGILNEHLLIVNLLVVRWTV